MRRGATGDRLDDEMTNDGREKEKGKGPLRTPREAAGRRLMEMLLLLLLLLLLKVLLLLLRSRCACRPG